MILIPQTKNVLYLLLQFLLTARKKQWHILMQMLWFCLLYWLCV